MSSKYEVNVLDEGDRERLERTYHDLLALSSCSVPSVRAAARASLAHIAQAMNGEGIAYELYTGSLQD